MNPVRTFYPALYLFGPFNLAVKHPDVRFSVRWLLELDRMTAGPLLCAGPAIQLLLRLSRACASGERGWQGAGWDEYFLPSWPRPGCDSSVSAMMGPTVGLLGGQLLVGWFLPCKAIG